jgi:hypothetical protein
MVPRGVRAKVGMMIFYRTLLDYLRREDSRYCSDCVSPVRARLIEAAEQRDRNWIFCQACRVRWTPSPDVDHAARGWMLVLLTGDPIPVAFLCADCAACNPQPATLPSIARLLLEHSRRPVQ